MGAERVFLLFVEFYYFLDVPFFACRASFVLGWFGLVYGDFP